jgi:SNF2 family DNA or RNA helicase
VIKFRPKTKPYKHQKVGLDLSRDKEAFALLMEQGTGKTKIIIDTIAYLWSKEEVNTALIIAPNGVQWNWYYNQLPTHMPDWVEWVSAVWSASMNKTETRAMDAVLRAPKGTLRVVMMNVEAFGMTAKALDFALAYLRSSRRTFTAIDESTRIKTPTAKTTKAIDRLRLPSAYRRILNGTPITNGPFDAFSQFGFLEPEILKTDSFTAFKAEYAEMESPNSGLMRHIAQRVLQKNKWVHRLEGAARDEALAKLLPQMVKRGLDGTPKYRNLDRLQRLIAPHSYRVLKKDCLDLPRKTYDRHYFDLTRQQIALYNSVSETMRIEWESGKVTALNKLTMTLRLQQITCGYVGDVAGEEPVPLFDKWSDNPRIVALLDRIADIDGSVIVWCRFTTDIEMITAALREAYGDESVVQYYGKIKKSDRAKATALFQSQQCRFFIGQESAGIGIDLFAASYVFYYSNSFSLDQRLQSEDRAHRIGLEHPVTYVDLEARGTVDRRIISALISKKGIADSILGDPFEQWIAPIAEH